ncbi:hypothetical protein [Burkholderia sp. BCC0322]|uniref:hypothetical protein n=1 Tax=unclassified Burkholderia TaxID=2613784 RepID=UPI001ABA2EA2|nr:hypothetical protein [Burkholderia sp. BCC0322]
MKMGLVPYLFPANATRRSRVMRAGAAKRMMRAILSNDDQDWHSHLEQSVKELGLDWQAGFFMIGGLLNRVCDGAGRVRRIGLSAPPGGRLRLIPAVMDSAVTSHLRQGRIALRRPDFSSILIPFVR